MIKDLAHKSVFSFALVALFCTGCSGDSPSSRTDDVVDEIPKKSTDVERKDQEHGEKSIINDTDPDYRSIIKNSWIGVKALSQPEIKNVSDYREISVNAAVDDRLENYKHVDIMYDVETNSLEYPNLVFQVSAIFDQEDDPISAHASWQPKGGKEFEQDLSNSMLSNREKAINKAIETIASISQGESQASLESESIKEYEALEEEQVK